MKFTDRELSVVVESVENAYYWLSRDGKHTSQSNWTVMMAKLERAHKAIGRAKARTARLALIAVALAVGGVFSAPAAIDPTTDVGALYAAIGRVESDSGRTSRNWYQLTPRYVRDCERITERRASPEIYRDKRLQERAMSAYWRYYGERYEERTSRLPNAEVLSKMHHVGYEGLRTRQRRADDYWRKVRPHYDQYRLDRQFKKSRKGGR